MTSQGVHVLFQIVIEFIEEFSLDRQFFRKFPWGEKMTFTIVQIILIISATGISVSHCQCEPGYTDTPPYIGICMKTFGEECNYISLECNIFRQLACSVESGTCTCNDPDTQIFDENRQACVSLVSFNCDHEDGDYNLRCIEGGFCDMPIIEGVMHHMCACNDGWTVTEELLCTNRTGSNDECEFDSDCDVSKFLTCDPASKKCICQDEQIFDQTKEACVSRVGFGCNEEEGLHCVEGGYCNTTDGVETNVCACNDGWTTTENLLCTNRTGFDEECELDSDCDVSKILTCDPITRKCACQKPDEQIFDQAKDACVSLVGFGCDHVGNLQCVEGAFCDMPMVDGVMQHMCACNDGLKPTEDLMCSGAHFLFDTTFSFMFLTAAIISNKML